MWKYATPHMHGLYKTHWLHDGLNQYMADHGLRGKAESMSIPALHLVAPRLLKWPDLLKKDCGQTARLVS